MSTRWRPEQRFCCPESLKNISIFFCLGLDIWVTQIMKSNVLYARIIQNFLMQLYYRVRMIHPTGPRRWEHIDVQRMLCMFLLEQLDSLLRQRYESYGCCCFRLSNFEFTVTGAYELLCYRKCTVFGVKVAPQQRRDFTFTQSACKLKIEQREDASYTGGFQVCFYLFRRKYLHLFLCPGQA